MMSNHLGRLFIAFLILATLAVCLGCDKKRILVSCLFALMSLASTFSMAISPFFPERSMLGSTVFLITGCAILASELLSTRCELILRCAMVVVVCLASVQFVKGGYDIAVTYRAAKVRESYILSEKAKGTKDVEVGTINPKTKYSPLYGLKDLDVQNPCSWPNADMARYYDVHSISVKQDKPQDKQ